MVLNIQSVFKIIPDYPLLYILDESNGYIGVGVYDADLKQIGYMHVGLKRHKQADPILDESCLYIPASGGQILALDKFSGLVLHIIDIGSMEIVAPLHQDRSALYCIAAIPIRHQNKLTLNNFSVIKIDKETFHKTYQSASQTISYGACYQDGIIFHGKSLIRLGDSLDEVGVVALQDRDYYPPLGNVSWICCPASTGIVEVFRPSLSFVNRVYVGASPLVPCLLGDTLFWGNGGRLSSVNLEQAVVQHQRLDGLLHKLEGIDSILVVMKENDTEVRGLQTCRFPIGAVQTSALFKHQICLASSDKVLIEELLWLSK